MVTHPGRAIPVNAHKPAPKSFFMFSLMKDGFNISRLRYPLQTAHQLLPIHIAIIADHCDRRDSAAFNDKIAVRKRFRLYPAHAADAIAQ